MRARILTILTAIVLAAAAVVGWIWTSPESFTRLPHWLQLRPSIYLDSALRQIETSGYGASHVDWPPVESRAKALAGSATSADGTYEAIRYALTQLPDHVSRLVAPVDESSSHDGFGLEVLFPERVVAVVYPGSAAEVAGIHAGDVIVSVEGHPPMPDRRVPVRGTLIEIPPPDTSLLVRPPNGDSREVLLRAAPFVMPAASAERLGDLGYVELPGSSAPGPFAQTVQLAIARADGPAVCGWVIDLRVSGSGDFDALLGALRAIVGEPPFGSSVDAGGVRTPWSYLPSDQPVAPLSHPFSPVALLTSRLTAGAAEGLVVAFKGRPATRSFGEPTRGTPTSTRTYLLADGAALELTSGYDVDRNGTVYRTRIAPDDGVPIDWAHFGTPTDPVVVAASTWLRAQPACRH